MQAWLSQTLTGGSWVLDPFGTSPAMICEAARGGYRVLVAASNPIARLLLEMQANPPAKEDLMAALAELAAAHRGEERIEPHIRSLYQTECFNCKAPVMAEYFLWERGAPAPYARFYECPYCKDIGERPVSQGDVDRARQFTTAGLHQARALERVAARNDPDRVHAEEALGVYLPRAVYALFTIINKLDALTLSRARRNQLHLLLLHAFDQANTLWRQPPERDRPKQLSIPPRFREYNIWKALEKAIELCSISTSSTPLVYWPALPPEQGGICLYEGRLKDLSLDLARVGIEAVITVLPRPNQAYWTLSALWAGWLWGREALGPFRSVLHRRRYDWAWHTAALSAAFNHLAPHLHAGTPLFGVVCEAEAGFISAPIIAAHGADFELQGLALRTEQGLAQISWRKAIDLQDQHINIESARGKVIQSALDYLCLRGSPSPYLLMKGAVLAALADAHTLHLIPKSEAVQVSTEEQAEPSPAQNFSLLQTVFKESFTYRNGFRRFDGSEQSLEIGQWWVREEKEAESPINTPLADRIELDVLQNLQKIEGCSFKELDRFLCDRYPGLLTPDQELVQVCLDSYGEQHPPGSGRWYLRAQDQADARHADLDTTRLQVRQLGERLGFVVSTYPASQETLSPALTPYYWQEADGDIRYTFYILTSAAIGEVVLGKSTRLPLAPDTVGVGRMIIVLPGSRANLAAYKLEHDPHLRQEVSRGWRLIKYRHLRQLCENPVLTADNLDLQLDLDPMTYTAPQIRLL